ncbi:MAG TPA: ATP-binding protein [Anaerolineae bacterium]|nr:ATP-binding protein [Anaerolineae bacterium]
MFHQPMRAFNHVPSRLQYILTLFVGLIIFTPTTLHATPHPSATATNGTLDLTTTDLSHKPHSLSGQWHFYWQQLLTLNTLPPAPTHTLFVPAQWHTDHDLPPRGYATYHLQINTTPLPLDTVLYIEPGYAAYEVEINGQTATKVGQITPDPAQSHASQIVQLIPLPPDTTQLDLIIRFANYDHRNGGLSMEAQIGPRPIFQKQIDSQQRIDWFLQGLLLIMLAYHLGIYILRRNQPSILYFAIFCLGISLRTTTLGNRYIFTLLPPNLTEWGYKLELFSFHMAAIGFIGFLSTIYYHHMPRWLARLMLGTFAFFGLLSIILPSYHASFTVNPFIICILLSGVSFVIILSRAAYHQAEGARILLASFAVVFLIVIQDTLQIWGTANPIGLSHIGVSLIVFAQAFILTQRFSAAFDRVEELSLDLRDRNQRLIQLDQLKDEFLANTSHELRTPLNGIIGLAESLLDGATGPLPTATQRNLNLIAASGRRLANLVNDILDFAKLKNHELTLQTKPIDMHTIADVVLVLSATLIGDKPVTLHNDIPPDPPLVLADENRIQQILYNLVGNAIKFTPQGEVRLTITTHPDHLAIHVQDTGIGIPPDKQTAIFESFTQADGSTARQFGGTGLGLSITKRLVELHGGHITLQSAPNHGSTFTFTLPTTTVTTTTPTTPTPTTATPATTTSPTLIPTLQTDAPLPDLPPAPSHGYKILIVDDEPVNLQVLNNYLTLANYHVTQATSGLEALALLDKEHFDVLILDIMMPQMSGYEVCQELRTLHAPHELPVVMLTAKNQVTDLVESFQLGANDYLTKPFSKDELLTRIKTHLQITRTNRAYGRFVPHEFLSLLGKDSILDVELGDQTEQEMTVSFSDIRNFTGRSEQMTPADTFRFLNQYLNKMAPIIHQYHGFIDKYIGDAIMALFPTNADDALQAAIDMLRQLRLSNQESEADGLPPIQIGIGLHTGHLMLGTVGNAHRMDGTVISDAVNLAARIEAMTKWYGLPLLISHSTYHRLTDPTAYHLRRLGQVQARGKAEIITLYEIFDHEPDEARQQKAACVEAFETAVAAYYQRQFAAAQQLLDPLRQQLPHDHLTHYYYHQATHFITTPPPADWTGAHDIHTTPNRA